VTTTRQEIRLADGRELFYYDSRPDADRSAPDRREGLPPVLTASQIRWNPLFRDYAVIASHRQSRTYLPPADQCPLCPSRPGASTEVPAEDYEVAVFENRFPSLALQSVETVPSVDEPPFKSGPGAGRCEVVSFTSDHNRSFAQLSPAHARTVIDAWADRTTELSRFPSIDYVFPFENRGEEIGVTLTHPHGQIYGYPFVPPRFYREVESAERHHERYGECLQCALLENELKVGDRVVTQTEHWVGYVPFAARWPYEVRVVPRRHLPDLPALDEAERDDLARCYLDVLTRFDALFDTPTPYIAGWQQAPVRTGRDVCHLAAEIFTIRRAPGKLKYLAGSESGAAVWINDITPEAAAERLRAVAA
jgi:UDPglucose--hexose-1-phosphate uridylyltransferase